MSSNIQHIKTILSLVMFEDGHKYYINDSMIENIDEFKNQLNNALDYYSLPMSADDIIIYVDENQYDDNNCYEDDSEESNESGDEEQNIGHGF